MAVAASTARVPAHLPAFELLALAGVLAVFRRNALRGCVTDAAHSARAVAAAAVITATTVARRLAFAVTVDARVTVVAGTAVGSANGSTTEARAVAAVVALFWFYENTSWRLHESIWTRTGAPTLVSLASSVL